MSVVAEFLRTRGVYHNFLITYFFNLYCKQTRFIKRIYNLINEFYTILLEVNNKYLCASKFSVELKIKMKIKIIYIFYLKIVLNNI